MRIAVARQRFDGGDGIAQPECEAAPAQEVQMIVSVVRFRSRLSDEDVQELFEQRAPQYRKVPGLAEKIYVRFRDTGEWGAVYVFDTEQSLARFRESELAKSIPSAYEVEGDARIELADVSLVMRQEGAEVASAGTPR